MALCITAFNPTAKARGLSRRYFCKLSKALVYEAIGEQDSGAENLCPPLYIILPFKRGETSFYAFVMIIVSVDISPPAREPQTRMTKSSFFAILDFPAISKA